ncbi:MAG: CehA/McbA family metallohydrolase [Planctomycetes bacterium]|nr:CehA/McbA family metallohydrolase [Planctomycetota bacterium]
MRRELTLLASLAAAAWACLAAELAAEGGPRRLEGRIVDAGTGAPLPGRLYIESSDGKRFHALSLAEEGSAVRYEKRNGESFEVHTTLSAHPFAVDLPAGTYTLTAERGKEWIPATAPVTVKDGEAPPPVTLKLRRWIDMAARGWWSGDTHVHRSPAELPNVLLAEDLNVAFPLVYWVTKAFTPPASGDRSAGADAGPRPVPVDATHVYYPRNTEYEIFTVGGRRHELGAVFLLGHRTVLEDGGPPMRPIAERVHAEGGLVELDKHCWPWSMALVPVMKVDLYELSNNHVWRAPFAFKGWGEPAADYMRIERDAGGWTERGWIDYGFKSYYALLDCGFRLRPTAGTASGVHPVPLGFSRVYVHIEGGFTYEKWVRGLDAGRSFVTTGPMLLADVAREGDGPACRVTGTVASAGPIQAIEVVVNGEVARSLAPPAATTPRGTHEARIDVRLELEGSSWVAVRAFEEAPGGRVRFAHGAPVQFDMPGKPLRPRREEAEWLARRVSDQIARSAELLPPAALEEYREALRAYEEAAKRAR